MFRSAPMKLVNLVVLDRDLWATVRAAGKLGVVHPVRVDELGWKVCEDLTPGARKELSSSYNSVERRIGSLLDTLGIAETQVFPTSVRPEHDCELLDDEVSAIEAEVYAVKQRRDETGRSSEHMELVSYQLKLLASVGVDIERLRRFDFVRLVVGLLPPANLSRLETSLEKTPHAIMPHSMVGERVFIFAATLAEHAEVLDRATKAASLERLEIPTEFSGTAESALDAAAVRLQQFAAERERLNAEMAQMRDKWRHDLLRLHHHASLCKSMLESTETAKRSERTVVVSGWVPEEQVPQLLSTVEEVTESRTLVHVSDPVKDYQPGPKPPTRFKNPAPVRPFEGLVSTFGLPAYGEIDPTPLVALAFVIMFGMMFGDLGHGLILMMAGALLAFRTRLPAGLKRGLLKIPLMPLAVQVVRDLYGFNAGWVLLLCGASASVFGLLYGSVFSSENLPALWTRPMDNVMFFLKIAVFFGVAVLSVALVCNLINRYRRREYEEGILGSSGLVAALMYWSAAGLAAKVLIGGGSVPMMLVVAVIFIPVLILFFREPIVHAVTRKGHIMPSNPGGYFVEAFFEVFDVVLRYLSNFVSFVRLSAFALNHIALSLAVFIIADMVGVGYYPVIVLGNIVIIFFESLIVTIQGLRLQYYEFFTKFFRGDGVSYKPLQFA